MSHAGNPRARKPLTKILVTPNFGLATIQTTLFLSIFGFVHILAIPKFLTRQSTKTAPSFGIHEKIRHSATMHVCGIGILCIEGINAEDLQCMSIISYLHRSIKKSKAGIKWHSKIATLLFPLLLQYCRGHSTLTKTCSHGEPLQYCRGSGYMHLGLKKYLHLQLVLIFTSHGRICCRVDSWRISSLNMCNTPARHGAQSATKLY